jgi:hypothetical protein
LVLLGFAACADILDIPEQPMLISAITPECAESLLHPPAPKRDRAHVNVHACSFTSGGGCPEAVPDLTATLCNTLDVECAMPLAQNLRSDENGDFSFDVPTGGPSGKGFDGFLRITSQVGLCTDPSLFGATAPAVCGIAPGCDPKKPDEKCRIPLYVSALVFFNPPVTADVPRPIVVPLILNSVSLQLIIAAGGKMADPTQGFVFATVLDCKGDPARDVMFDLMPTPTLPVGKLYLTGGVLSGAMMTDDTGTGGLLGVPQGFKTITANRTTKTGMVESGMAGIKVEPQTGSYVSIILAPGP